MEVRFSPDLEAKIARIATEQGREASALVNEAVERFVSYDEWFVEAVKKGLAEAEAGHFVEHDDMQRLIQSRYPG